MKKYIFILSLFSGVLFSCEDEILNKEPLDIISSAVVWDDEVFTEAYIADVYNSLPFMHYGNHPNDYYDMPMLETLTDQAGGSRDNRDPARKKVGQTIETGGLIEMWLYPQIRKINEFYENIASSTIIPEQKNTFIGCIKFVEAFSYFEMAKRYGAVPVITEAQQIDDPEEELYPSRTPEVQVYEYAIGLLDEILDQELLGFNEKAGYPTKGAALALKSRIALYAASIARFSTVQLDGLLGVHRSDENKFWQMAYDAADAVIKSGNYSLYKKFPGNLPNRFYRMSIDKDNPERIFVKKYDGTNVGHSYDFSMAPVGFAPVYACANAAPYLDFVESFEKTDGSSSEIPREWETNDKLVTPEDLYGEYDPRMKGAILHEGSIYQGEEVNLYQGLRLPDGSILDSENGSYEGVSSWGESRKGNSSQQLYTGFSVKKYLDEDYMDPQNGLSSTDKVILRLGEMYLNRAEAAFYLNNGDKGLADINILRERAGMPLRTIMTEEFIRYERMAELCFEDGARYWDLIRWRTAVDAITRDFSGIRLIKDFETGKYLVRFDKFIGTAAPYESRFGVEHYYKPITPNRIANNPNLAPENPGY
jgi:starch-binding outer membrane protein, SusD/RagB family